MMFPVEPARFGHGRIEELVNLNDRDVGTSILLIKCD
jgi:hypothetical protein